jgi:hypothetical protein
VADEVVDDLLDNSDSPGGKTVWSALKPVAEGTGDVRPIRPIEPGHRNLFLLPGDIRLSEFEVELADFWGECLQRRIRGFRGTAALSALVNRTSQNLDADYVLYDAGPNIGPLNRVILLDCDYLIVPVAYDLFSVRALKTLGHTLKKWITDWRTILQLAPEETYLLPGRPIFIGYVAQGFRIYRGTVASHHHKWVSRIERGIFSDVIAVLRTIEPSLAPRAPSYYKLGEIQNLGSLVPASQAQGVPIYKVDAGTPDQKDRAGSLFTSIASKIVERTSSGRGADVREPD